MDSLYVTSLRSWLRRLGLIRLVSLPAKVRTHWRHACYHRHRYTHQPVQVGQSRAIMVVADAFEYARVLSFHEDRHIIQGMLNRVSAGDACWDVGSSIGLYTLLLAKAVGPAGIVLAFDPEVRSFQRLLQNIEMNDLHNVRTFPIALGRQRGKMDLRVDAQASSGTHFIMTGKDHWPPMSEARIQVVDVIPGDVLRKQEKLRVPSVIKLDVEGAEEDVLAGLQETLQNSECRTVICEIHFALLESRGDRKAPVRILEFLRNCGFNSLIWMDHSHIAAYR